MSTFTKGVEQQARLTIIRQLLESAGRLVLLVESGEDSNGLTLDSQTNKDNATQLRVIIGSALEVMHDYETALPRQATLRRRSK